MDINDIRLNEECHACVSKIKGSCKGKETRIPCIAYKSKNQYAQESIKAIKVMVRK